MSTRLRRRETGLEEDDNSGCTEEAAQMTGGDKSRQEAQLCIGWFLNNDLKGTKRPSKAADH